MKTIRSTRDAATASDYTKFSALCIRRFFETPAFSGESAFFARFRYFDGVGRELGGVASARNDETAFSRGENAVAFGGGRFDVKSRNRRELSSVD